MHKAPAKLRAAFAHIRKYHPDVIEAVFLSSGTWLYFDHEGEAPTFDKKINVATLEAARDEVETHFRLPVAFSYRD